jgi:hypothetical protein
MVVPFLDFPARYRLAGSWLSEVERCSFLVRVVSFLEKEGKPHA